MPQEIGKESGSMSGTDIAALIGANPAAPRLPKQKPSYKLSVELLATYKNINDMFYAKKRKESAAKRSGNGKIFNEGFDDDGGNYVVQIGEEIAQRYIVQDILGKGSFGVVVKAHDHRRDENVALKVIKNKPQFTQQAKVEIDILSKLVHASKEDHNIVVLKKFFTWKNHLCLVFELLSFNLYDLIKYTKFCGVSLTLIRKFAYQILRTLEFLAHPTLQIIHCDLKPENILLKNPKRSGIKVVDFGSSCYLTKRMFKYIQSRFYRAPEVILGLQYTCAIDMWSLGCILVEMHTGFPVFDGKDEADQLLKMHGALGALPPSLVAMGSPKKKQLFFVESEGQLVLKQIHQGARVSHKPLADTLGAEKGGPHGRRTGQPGHSPQDYERFIDLINGMLTYDPVQRISPMEALQHPFVVSFSEQAAAAEMEKTKTDLPGPSVSATTSSSNLNASQPHHMDPSQSSIPMSTVKPADVHTGIIPISS
ncbi:Serine/threonine-protein kinase minibrain [Diplonema papillatum]|nr:Serine/threonine-protein kinase minibrain [Diplonema papillatum]